MNRKNQVSKVIRSGNNRKR